MAKKIVIKIVLPLMPDPEKFKGAGINHTADGGLYILALNAWDQVCLKALEKGFELQLPDGSEHPEEVPRVVDKTKN